MKRIAVALFVSAFVAGCGGGSQTNHVDTRDELLEYDPRLHEVISRYFAATDWSPSCPSS